MARILLRRVWWTFVWDAFLYFDLYLHMRLALGRSERGAFRRIFRNHPRLRRFLKTF